MSGNLSVTAWRCRLRSLQMNRLVIALVFVLGTVAVRCTCRDEPIANLRVATFNIENFPKSARQIAGAFDEMKRLEAPIIGVQEITDLDAFRNAARDHLGKTWQAEFISTGSVLDHHLGVLFDRSRVRHVKTRVHDGTRLGSTHKPVMDVELAVGSQRV